MRPIEKNARGITGFLGLAGAALVAACGGSGNGQSGPAVQPVAPAARLGCEAQPGAPSPIAAHRTGATVALARWGGRTVAFVSDEDERAVHAVDLDAKKHLASLDVGSTPGQLLVAADGRVLVTLRESGQLAVIHALDAEHPRMALGCATRTAVEPVGIAMTPDDRTILVASQWGARLAAFDASTLERRFQVKLPRDPYAVTVSDDGKRAFVSHVVGARASIVELGEKPKVKSLLLGAQHAVASERAELMRQAAGGMKAEELPAFDEHNSMMFGRARTSCQGFALAKSVSPEGRIFAPQVLVDPGDATARTSGYGDGGGPAETPSIAVIDDATERVLPISVDNASAFNQNPMGTSLPECLLPRAAVVDAERGSLFVACVGLDAIVEYDADSPSPTHAEKRRFDVPSGPTGIAVDSAANRLVVWSQFERTVSAVPLGGLELVDEGKSKRKVAEIALPSNPARALGVKATLGRLLFHSTSDQRISSDGRACASCHPGGREDAVTWATPNGPRRTRMLAGRLAGTAPYSWDGDNDTLEEHVTDTMSRLSGNGRLRSLEIDALLEYIQSLPSPPVRSVDSEVIDRGRAIFASTEAGCASCHTGKVSSDNLVHDVSSRTVADRSAKFDTPSLLFLSGRAPYFHDGRFATLADLVEKVDGKMGHTAQLSPDDRKALVAFLETL